MDPNKAAEELKVIRQLMERPIRYSTMSGLSGILAGCITLLGLLADSIVCSTFDSALAIWINMAVWAGVFLAALSAALGLTRVRERRQGMPFWSPIKRKILLTILPPFVAGAGLTAIIVYQSLTGVFAFMVDGPDSHEWVAPVDVRLGLIAPVWMLFYGVACWQLGELSIKEIRILGAAFIAAGLICAGFFQATIPGLPAGTAPYWTLGATFGLFHIVYGFVVRIRYGG